MTRTTLLFLKSYLSRDKFADALAWVKARERRLYLPAKKLWVLELRASPSDPEFEACLDEVRDSGWTIVGSTLWDASVPLRGQQESLESLASLAELAVDGQNRKAKTL